MKILRTEKQKISPWVSIVVRHLKGAGGREIYHGLEQEPYVGIFAVRSDGKIPLVRQFRPIPGVFTWEFPAGTLHPKETPLLAARRELREETGLAGGKWTRLGPFLPDTGRLAFASHGFFALGVSLNGAVAECEPGLKVQYVNWTELRRMVLEGKFRHQLHLGLLASVILRQEARLGPETGFLAKKKPRGETSKSS